MTTVRETTYLTTVRETTYRLLRELGLTTIFGNPGSTELPFLSNLPSDFTYILGLQEASVVAMADGYAQATRHAALVNVHTAPGLGNAMGNVINAYYNHSPLIITAGQQVRATMLMEPHLFALQAVDLPKPYVKWSYEPARPQDIPAALARAYYTAMQPPWGPVFLSLPMDDWDVETEPYEVRTVSQRVAPDPAALELVAQRLRESQHPALIVGAGVERSGAWDLMVQLAEQTNAAVWTAPYTGRPGFPETHPLFQGYLPFAQAPLAERLSGTDVAVVFGAPVFSYYAYMPGRVVPPETDLFQITDDPSEAERAVGGTGIVGDVSLALEYLLASLPAHAQRLAPAVRPSAPRPTSQQTISVDMLMSTLGQMLPPDAIVVEEAPSMRASIHRYMPVTQSGGYYTSESGGLGLAMPAAVGIQLAEPSRPVVCVIGDGSSMYSVQALYTAAQLRTPVIYIVPRNGEYAILKSFARFEEVNNVPGLDLPNLDVVQIAQGLGCRSWRITRPQELSESLSLAFHHQDGPVVIEVTVDSTSRPLL